MPSAHHQGRQIVFTAVFYDTSQPDRADVGNADSHLSAVEQQPRDRSVALNMSAAGSFFTRAGRTSVAAAGLSSFAATAPGQVTGASRIDRNIEVVQ